MNKKRRVPKSGTIYNVQASKKFREIELVTEVTFQFSPVHKLYKIIHTEETSRNTRVIQFHEYFCL